jgi:hypothetical protein
VTAERYTAVFTGFLSAKKPGEYLYLSMSEEPSGPGGSSSLHHGRPPFEHMGRGISFHDFPEECRQLVLETYQKL